jgi:cytochrome c5
MSEAPHQAPIKTPGQLIAAVVAAFAIPIIVIWLLAYYVNQSERSGAGTNGLADAAVASRIAPLAKVDVRNPNAPHVYKTGEEVFKAVCTTCHTPGAAGAPKFGNTSDWAPRISQGYETLVKTALQGKGAMPPRGGTSPDDYSDYEIARAVVYMADHSGANFPEPAAPASGTAATQNTAAAASGASEQSASASTGSVNDQAAAAIAALPSAPAPTSSGADKAQAGKALYTQVCQACHAAGVMGAPKFGNKADWVPRLKDPMDTIYNYALHEKGNMPPKGGSQASDDDVKAAVDYMVNAAK